MGLTFREAVGQSGTEVFFWLEIDGVDVSFWSCAPPDAWLVSGRVNLRLPWPTLKPPDAWQGLEQRAEPFAGISAAGRTEVPIRVSSDPDDPLLSWVANDVASGSVGTLFADLNPGATKASIYEGDQISDFPSSGYLYVGRETMLYNAISSGSAPSGIVTGTFEGLTRGYLDSPDLFHGADPDYIIETGLGGPYVASRPLTFAGRRVRIYCGTGFRTPDGELIPHGTTGKLIFSGFLRDSRFDAAMGEIRLSIESVRSCLSEEGGVRLPRATPGIPNGDVQRIYLSDDNNEISWAWYPDGSPSGSQFNYSLTRLQRSGSAGNENVPDGWYNLGDIGQFVSWTMSSGSHPSAGAARSISLPFGHDLYCRIGVISDENGTKNTVRFGFSGSVLSNITHEIGGGQVASNLFRELGFTNNQAALVAATAPDYYEWTYTADRPRPAFYLPAGRLGREIAYTQLTPRLPLQPNPGFLDDDGNVVDPYLKIGDEIVTFATGSGNIGLPVVRITRRGQLNSRPEEIYIEDTMPRERPDVPEIVQGVVIPRTSWGRIALQIACGGGLTSAEFDKGWRGSGAALPQEYFDTGSFLDLGYGIRTFARFESFKVDEELKNEAVLGACAIVERSGQIMLVSTLPPLESEQSAFVALNTNNMITLGGQGVQARVSESQILNHMVATDIGWNPATGESREEITWIDGTSAGTWGQQKPVAVSMKNVIGAEYAQGQFFSLVSEAGARWSRPFYAIDLLIALPEDGWTIDVLDDVRISHPLILDRAAPGRGVSAMSGRVYGVRPIYNGDGVAARARVLAYGDASRFTGYAPSAYCTAVDTSASGTTFRCLDHYDSRDGEEIDVNRFAVGDTVRLYTPGGGSSEDMTVTAINDVSDTPGGANKSEIHVSGSTSLTAPFIIEFPAISSSSEDQRLWAYISGFFSFFSLRPYKYV